MQENGQQATIKKHIKANRRLRCAHDFFKFYTDAFRADNIDAIGAITDALKRGSVNMKAQLRSKTDSPKHTQRVVAESLERLNGRVAMLGFSAAILGEWITGKGIVGQLGAVLAWYLS